MRKRRFLVTGVLAFLLLGAIGAGCTQLQALDTEPVTTEDLALRVQVLEQELADMDAALGRLQAMQPAEAASAPAENGEGMPQDAAQAENADAAGPEVVSVAGTPGYLRVRAEPSVESAHIGTLTEGAQVQVLERQDDWARINFQDRLEGWVAAQYLE